MSRTKDLTFKIPSTKTVVEVWSSNYTDFRLENKLIKITLDNTVSDILEVISLRSIAEGGNLNPRCMRIYHRHQEVLPYQPLSDFLQQEEHTNRLRVEINNDLLNSTTGNYIRHALLNINLKLASGKTISVGEPLTSTIASLKSYITESIGLDESHIDHFIFNGGITVHNESQTLAHLLDLDIAPLGELNFYVTLHSDFLINLSSPVENILRTNKTYAMLDTSILTIKYFIIDQYVGPNQIKPEDIKIIYFGRIISDKTKLKDIILTLTVDTNLTFHFVLKEPEEPLPSQGFWSDLRRGALFEFLPREPNPNFQAEVQRDERLREQLRNGTAPANLPNESVLVQDDVAHLSHSTSENSEHEEHQYVNGHERLPAGNELTGESLDILRKSDGELVNVNQLDMATAVYKISLNTINGHQEVILSSSQVIINDSDPSNPYLMLSPSGYAKLQNLGVAIENPTIRIDETPVINLSENNNFTSLPINTGGITSATNQTSATIPPQPTPTNTESHLNQNQPHNQQQQHQQQRQRQVNYRQFNWANLTVQLLFPMYGVLKYCLLYTMFSDMMTNDLLHYLFIFSLVVHFLTRSSNSHILDFIRTRLIPERVSSSVLSRLTRFQESLKLRTVAFLEHIIELSLPLHPYPLPFQLFINIGVGAFSFIVTFIPILSGLYIRLIEQRKLELRLFENLDNVNESSSTSTEVRDSNGHEPTGHVLGTVDIDNIVETDGTTGIQPHHEN